MQVCDGDLGLALEYLLAECFHLNNTNISATEDSLIEITDQKNDEMVALQAIYEDRFIERIPQKVWIVKLHLPHLDKLIQPVRDHKLSKTVSDDREICRFFVKGFCKFGRRCKMRHDSPATKVMEAERTVEQNTDLEHEVEIRFPSGNLYPREAPFIAFTSSSRLEKHVCLNITKHMVLEAKSLAENCEPSVFSMINLLEDDSFLEQVLNEPPHEFSCSPTHRPWLNSSPQKPSNVSYSHQDMKPQTDNDTGSQTTDKESAKTADAMIRMTDRAADLKIRGSPELERVEIKRSSSREEAGLKKINPGEVLKTNKKLIEDFRKKQVAFSQNYFHTISLSTQSFRAFIVFASCHCLITDMHMCIVLCLY